MNPKRLVHTVKGERTIRPEHPPSILDPGPPLPFPPPPCPARLPLAPSGLLSIDLTRLSGSRIGDWPVHDAECSQCRRFVRPLLLSSTRPDRTTEFLAPASPSSIDQRGNTSELRRPIPPIPAKRFLTYHTVTLLGGGSFANTLACVCHM